MAGQREALVRTYDEIRYPYLAHRHTDPDRLATIARFHGIVTPPVEKCRVLEVGCAVGGNLASLAMPLPGAQFVGFDISEGQIEQGRAAMTAAGVGNVALVALDLMDVGTMLGTFDYIVAHGVLSWISPDAQDELFALIARSLAPNGVAYVSYNARPGWHELSVVRDGMIFDMRGVEDPHERVQRAREYLDWLLTSMPDGGRYGQRFIEEVKLVQSLDDQSLTHEYLGPYHMPIHFQKVAARANHHGLAYLCDAEPALSADHSLAPEAERARQRSPGELVFAEQYYDFLTNRRFRRTLLCRRGAKITRNIDARLVDEMFVSSRGQSAHEPSVAEVRGKEPLTFSSAESDLTTASPLMKAALVHLASVAPRAISFSELVAGVRERLSSPALSDAELDELRSDMVHAYFSSVAIVTLRTYAPPCATEPADRPIATAWARHAAREVDRVPSLDHEMVRLDDVLRRIVPLLDGTRDRAALEAELDAMVARGEIELRAPDGRPGRPAPGAMEGALRSLARSGILVR
jgi:methyltransferase-like protein/SAM-dependent methyltransferase